MLRSIFAHLRAQWMGALALFLVIAGGTAYAANTVFSADIVDGEVKAVDLANNSVRSNKIGTDEVRSVDLRNDNLSGGGLRGVDIANAASGSDSVNADKLDGLDSSGLVQGGGKVLASRFIMSQSGELRTLLEIPGLGRLDAGCLFDRGEISFTNTTNADVDLWVNTSHRLIHPFGTAFVLNTGSTSEAATVALGFGDDPGARRTATVHSFATQAVEEAPCVFQAQGMLWTAE